MKKYDISILIPARNEMFVADTVRDILRNKRGNTEVIVGLDGQWAEPGIPDHPDVRVVYVSESIGQRAMTNRLCRLSSAKWVIKCDAHCAFDEGFDVKLLETPGLQDDWTLVPTMKNLHAFDWVCPSGHRRYQGPSGECKDCGKPTERDVVWVAKDSPKSNSYRFDRTLHFQYFGEFNKRPEGQGEVTPTMSLQGSFFMLARAKYWELNICDEGHGSWGQQGVEVACKTWLSGGQVMVNQKTWYAHMFRTQGGDFGFPYEISNRQVEHARKYSRDLWLGNKWPLAKYDLQWLLAKFAPVPGWEPTKGIIYYTAHRKPIKLATKVQRQLRHIAKEKGLSITSSSHKPMDKMGRNVVYKGEPGYMAMFNQIVMALEASDADIVYFCEDDVLYHPSHFDFKPARDDKFYYNQNWWKIRMEDGFAAHWDANQVSGLVCYREHALSYYRNRLKEIEEEGFNRSYEPGGRDASKYEVYNSEFSNIDFRPKGTLTGSKWSPNDFRDKTTCINWQESRIENIPGWDADQLGGIL